MNKRGAYFFVVDAILGGSIFLITLIIIMSSHINDPIKIQNRLLAEDTMDFLMNTKILDFKNNNLNRLQIEGHITNLENTLFQQISEFYYKGNDTLAANFTSNLLELLLSNQYGYSYYIGGELIYNTSAETLNTSRVHLTSRKITFYVPNETNMYGPEIAELRLWS